MSFSQNPRLEYSDHTFDLDMVTYQSLGVAEIKRFSVKKECRGKGIGLNVFKDVAKACDAENISALYVKSIMNDGVTFWPRIGALPRDLSLLYNGIVQVRKEKQLSDNDEKLLAQALEVSQIEPENAWFSLTDQHAGLSKDGLFDLNSVISLNQTMSIYLKNLEVRNRLGLNHS